MSTPQLQLLVTAPDGTEAVPDAAFFRLNAMTLAVEATMPESQFIALGRQIATLNRGVQFIIGDWLIHAKKHQVRSYDAAAEIFGMEVSTLKKAFYVASAIPPARRRDALSFDHHETAAKLEEPEQEKWLGLAEKEHLSGKEMRESVKRGEVVRLTAATVMHERDAGQNGPLIAIANLAQAIANAKREYGENPWTWPKDVLARWEKAMAPIVTFSAEVRQAVRS